MATISRALMAMAMLLASGSFVQPIPVRAATCDNTAPNPIQCENALPGSPISEWDVAAPGPDDAIHGFSNEISYTPGQTVTFKVETPAASYKLAIYRLGYYAGLGARLVGSATITATLPQAQPACTVDTSLGLVDCDNWAASATWTIPAGAVSGVYVAKLSRTDTGFTGSGQNHIPFIVRDDNSQSDLVFQTSDTTWQAYNDFGGASLYSGGPIQRAVKVSYNRPFRTNLSKPETWLFADEEPMIRFLEANGYNVSYISGVDTDRYGATLLPKHKVYLSVGHDEYWSANQRANVEAARDGLAHVNLAFFSGNEVFWKTRWENSVVTPTATYRTLVSYKETQSPFPQDPLEPAVGTATWRDPRFGQDGGRPENALSGNFFMVNGTDYRALQVPANYAGLRFWRNTPIATSGGGTIAAGCGCVLGYEWDAEYDNGSRPAGLIELSSSTYTVPALLQDYGASFGTGSATHHLTLYKAASGALVFGAGTINYAAALDAVHSGPPTTVDPSLRQATVNLFADMGVQPATIQSNLTLATASADTIRPTSSITSIRAGAHVAGGTDVVVNGTASDIGGQVGGVEVSVDGGTTWHTASGTTSWTYTWRVNGSGGATTILSRATDDSANQETGNAGVAITVDPAVCPCSLFHATDAPPNQGALDAQPVLVGTRFRADANGYINAIRFYKPTGAVGTHTAVLWDNNGQRLAIASFANETASGWQQASFSSPVAVTANTVYVASYFSTNGGYASTPLGFGQALDNAPLHAIKDGSTGRIATAVATSNGVYQYTGAVPVSPTWSTFNSSNYWVDVVFNTALIDNVPPTVVSNASTSGATGLPLDATPSATFSEDIRPSTASLTLQDPSGASLAGQVTYAQATFTETFTPSGPLALNTTYKAIIDGVQDLAGNAMAAPFTFNLSTPACPCSFWDNLTQPREAAHADAQAVELGMHFHPHVDGYITGIRIYRGAPSTGSLVGNLWNTGGTSLLATVNIGPSSTVGWITANFSPAVYVTPGTDYVISYFAPNGNYAANTNFFATIDTDVGPLRAPILIPSGTSAISNGVYRYAGVSGFPSNPTSTNYWVDPIFNPSIGGAGVQILAPQVLSFDQTTAKLAWTTDKLSDSLAVYGTTNAYGASSLLDTKQVTSHTVQLKGLTPATTYHYQVKSRDSAGNQALSADLTFTTAAVPDTTPPTITNVVKNNENSSTKQLITWTTNEVADTRLAWGLTAAHEQQPLNLDTTSPVLSHKVELTGLLPSTTYHFQIGSADPSANLTTLADDTFTTGEVQISGVNAMVASDITGDSSATISWTSDAPATTVLDYGLTSAYGTNVTVADPVTSHSVPLTGLTPGTTYHYRVQSTANGHTATSGDLTFTTSDHQPPKITAISSTQVDFTTETVTWTTDEAATTEIDYSTDTKYASVATAAGLTTAHSITLSGLASGTTYHFIIKSADRTGNLATTGDETFTTKAPNPPQINSGPTASVTYNSATLTWGTTIASDTQVSYGLTPSYGSTSPLNSTPVTSHTVTLAGLSPLATYHYQVLSRDPTTNLLASSADLTFTTPAAPDTTPPVVTNINVAVTTTTATLSWTTNEPADSQVEYGLTTSYGTTTILDKTLVLQHTVSLAGLAPNTTYYIRISTRDAAKNLAQQAAQFKTLPLPRSLSLNGTTAYAEAPNAVNLTGDLTVETWFKDTFTSNGVATYYHQPTAILVKGDVSTDKEVPFAIGIAYNQLFITEKTNNAFSYMYYDLATTRVTPNAWHHLAYSVKASTRQATLYLDGVQVLQGTLSAVTTVGNAKPLTFGRNGGSTGYGNWVGLLDDVRLWNVTRSAQDIAANYSTEYQTPPANLVANWRFNEGSGTVAADAISSTQSATLYGGATWSTDVHK